MYALKPLGKGGLRHPSPRKTPGVAGSSPTAPSSLDNASISVLRSDLLVLQRRIDILRREPIILSATMQDQESFLFSLPPISEGETHVAVQLKLFEALLHKVRELCGMLLVVTGRDPRATSLIPKDIPPLRSVFNKQQQPSLPPSSGTGTAADLRRPHPPVHPANKGNARHPAPLPLAPNQVGPAGLPSFIDMLVSLSEAVQIVVQAHEDDPTGPSPMEIQKLEAEKKALKEDLANQLAQQKNTLLAEKETQLKELDSKHKKHLQKVTEYVEELKVQLSKKEDKQDKRKEQGPSREQYVKEIRDLHETNKRLTEDLDLLNKKVELCQSQYKAGAIVAFDGVYADFMRNVGLDVVIPTLETDTFLEKALLAEPDVTLASHRAPHAARGAPRTSLALPSPTSRSLTPTAPSTLNVKLKDKKDIAIAELQGQCTTLKYHIATLQATLKQQNNVMHQIAQQMPKILEDSYAKKLAAEKEAARNGLLMKSAFEDRTTDVLSFQKQLSAKNAQIEELNDEIERLSKDREEDSQLLVQHLKQFVPQIATPTTVVKPETINMRMNKLEIELAKRQRMNTEFSAKIADLENKIKSQADMIESKQQTIQSIEANIDSWASTSASLNKVAVCSDEAATLERQRKEHVEQQLAKVDTECSNQFETIKVLELTVTKAKQTIVDWKKKHADLQILLEKERNDSAEQIKVKEDEIQKLEEQIQQNAKEHLHQLDELQSVIRAMKDESVVVERRREKSQRKILQVFDLDKQLLRSQYIAMQQIQQCVSLAETGKQLQQIEQDIHGVKQFFVGADRWPIPHLSSMQKECRFLYDLVADKLDLRVEPEENED